MLRVMAKPDTPKLERGVPIPVVHLIDAFCRRNLSEQEIEFLAGLFWSLSDATPIGSGRFFEVMKVYLETTNGGISQVVTSVPTLMRRAKKD